MNMSVVTEGWITLIVAILFGVFGTISMKVSHGLKHFKPTLCVAFFYLVSFTSMTFAVKYIQLSIVYAVWSGVGTILVSIVGILFFNEHLSRRKVLFLILIVMGVIGIHLGDSIHAI